jgi:hypothetical protein
MADQRRSSHEWECFTCGGCAKPVRRRRLPNSPPGWCLCCSFLDAVRDARMREALRRVLEPGGGPVAEPRANWRFDHQADGAGNAGQSLP